MVRTGLLCLLLFVPVLAQADIAPPPGYVESCTLAKQTGPGRSCRVCSTYHGDPADKCQKESGVGFTRACRTSGASVWDEVWCKNAEEVGAIDAATPSATPAADAATSPASLDASITPAGPATSAKSSSCALGTAGGAGAQSVALALAACIGLLISRRRKH